MERRLVRDAWILKHVKNWRLNDGNVVHGRRRRHGWCRDADLNFPLRVPWLCYKCRSRSIVGKRKRTHCTCMKKSTRTDCTTRFSPAVFHYLLLLLAARRAIASFPYFNSFLNLGDPSVHICECKNFNHPVSELTSWSRQQDVSHYLRGRRIVGWSQCGDVEDQKAHKELGAS